MTATQDFAAKFRTADLYVTQVGTWDIAVRPGQLTLGAMVISARSGALHFTELDSQEHADMGGAFAVAERLALTCFGAVRINLLCLMMQDPIVHFHALPRYATPQKRFGQSWTDADWPGPPMIGPCETPEPVLQHIRNSLRAAV
jgi:diadenosine tetraphosphate (Ap4A) HIT family hydrolase